MFTGGMEGSLIAVMVSGTFTGLMPFLLLRSHRIVPPAWKRTIGGAESPTQQ
jgi:hypothetical protein